MLLVIDNYDSFTYNLVQAFGALGASIRVHRNNAIGINDIEAMKPTHIVLSPGPGTPRDAGVTLDVVGRFAGRVPLLGVCLGHQAIAEHFGAKVVRAPVPTHGKIAHVEHSSTGIFEGLPQRLPVARYHSLVADAESLPPCLEVTATYKGLVMGLRHRTLLNVEGVQFHPESFLSEHGPQLLKNFLNVPSSPTRQVS